jgi:hypothetical protein
MNDSKIPITSLFNQNNIENVRMMIAQKKSNTPFHATQAHAGSIITDYDHFPYTRNFRGVYDSSDPVVNEREAGWRARHDSCYKVEIPKHDNIPYSNLCFSNDCSVVKPCHQHVNKDINNVILYR